MIPDDAHVALVGLMGVGKTTTGAHIALLLDRPFVDCDAELQRVTGRTAAVIAEADGLDVLHGLEATVLLAALRAPAPSVVTAAASTIEDARCREALRGGAYVVWLRADPVVLVRRAQSSAHRPLNDDDDADAVLRAQAQRRDPLFAEVADIVVDASSASVPEVAAQIVG